MNDIIVLTEADLRRCVTLDGESIAAIEEAFRALATKPVAMPPILRLDIPEANGEKLTADVTRISFNDLQNGVISTSNGQLWTTSDGGRTWQRK